MLRPVALLALLLAAPAIAQVPEHPALRDKLYFGAGLFFPQTTTQAQLDSNRLGVGTNIDFEQSLDMARSKTVPSFFGRWRLAER